MSKGSEAQKRPNKLLWMLWFDKKSIANITSIFQSSLGQEDTQVFYVYSKDSKSISLPEIEMGNENCKKEGYIHIFDMAIYFWINITKMKNVKNIS